MAFVVENDDVIKLLGQNYC